jgi:hypothetical protein
MLALPGLARQVSTAVRASCSRHLMVAVSDRCCVALTYGTCCETLFSFCDNHLFGVVPRGVKPLVQTTSGCHTCDAQIIVSSKDRRRQPHGHNTLFPACYQPARLAEPSFPSSSICRRRVDKERPIFVLTNNIRI